jgi:signal recognition particle subunit SRP54
MRSMGGMSAMLDKLPGAAGLPQGVKGQVGDGELTRLEAIINSMTPQERRHPGIIKGSRKRRIAAGSGNQVQDVNRLLKQFMQMQKMMKRMRKKGGLARLMQGMKGGLPPGMPG